MKTGDLHRVDAALLADDRAMHVAGEVEQRTGRGGALDSEAISDAAFSVRVWVLFALYVVALLVALGLAVPWALGLLRQGLAP